MRIAVEVTARDIKLGNSDTVSSCPLGRAINAGQWHRDGKDWLLVIDTDRLEVSKVPQHITDNLNKFYDDIREARQQGEGRGS